MYQNEIRLAGTWAHTHTHMLTSTKKCSIGRLEGGNRVSSLKWLGKRNGISVGEKV